MTRSARSAPLGEGNIAVPMPFPLDRLNYFYGQMLGVRDFQDEQRYFHEKNKLHNRFLHGHGVVCGLAVEEFTAPLPRPPMPPPIAPPPHPLPADCRAHVLIESGLALDPEGNELIVSEPLCVNLWECLSEDDRKSFPADRPKTVYLILHYRQLPIEPSRPALPGACGELPTCNYARIRDGLCVEVSLEPPAEVNVCTPCHEVRPGTGELLARIDNFSPYQPGYALAVDNSVRRPVGLYRPTRIAGINWAHGGIYSFAEADRLIQAGLRIGFTGPVRPETIQPGIFDAFRFEGGGSQQGDIKNMGGDVHGVPDPDTHLVTEVHLKLGSKKYYERLSPGDRVLITFRSAFVLDLCCQPVDGYHVGGRVPLLPDGIRPDKKPSAPDPLTECGALRGTHGLWTSGNGAPGGNFESWFYVDHDPSQPGEDQA